MSKRNQQRSEAGHNPFQRLNLVLERAGVQMGSPETAGPDPVEHLPAAGDDSEETLFCRAMQGVVRSSWRHIPVPASSPSPESNRSQELEDRRLMQAAIDGDPAPAIFDHPEYIEGWVDLAGKRFLPQLRGGLYSIQGQI